MRIVFIFFLAAQSDHSVYFQGRYHGAKAYFKKKLSFFRSFFFFHFKIECDEFMEALLFRISILEAQWAVKKKKFGWLWFDFLNYFIRFLK